MASFLSNQKSYPYIPFNLGSIGLNRRNIKLIPCQGFIISKFINVLSLFSAPTREFHLLQSKMETKRSLHRGSVRIEKAFTIMGRHYPGAYHSASRVGLGISGSFF